jgi:soluble lytic murein transglycosylase
MREDGKMRIGKTARRHGRGKLFILTGVIWGLLAASAPAAEGRIVSLEEEFETGLSLYREGKYLQAAEVFEKAAKEAPESLRGEALFMGAQTAKALQNWDEAGRLFAQAEERFPGLADYAAFFRGETLRKKEEQKEALRVFQGLTEKYPESLLVPGARLQMAEILLEQGEPEKAFSLCARVLAADDTREPAVQARFLMARAKENEKDWDQAARFYLEIWLRHPLNPGAKTAREKYEALLEEKKISPIEVPPEDSFRRIQTLSRARLYDTALSEMERLEGFPREAYPAGYGGESWIDEFYFQRGVIFFWRKRFHQAEESFRLVVENARNPEAGEKAFFWRLRTLDRLGRGEEVLGLADAFPERYPEGVNRDRVLQLKAQILEDRGRTEEAIAAYREIAAKFPRGPLVLPSLWKAGWLLLEKEDWEEAVKTWEAMEAHRAVSPWSEKALYWRGKALERGGRKDRAEEVFGRLSREYPAAYHAQLAAGRNVSPGAGERFRPLRDALPARAPAGDRGSGEVRNPRLKKGILLSRLNLFPEALAELEATERNGNPGEEVRLEVSGVFREMGEYHRSNLLIRRNFSLRPLAPNLSPRDLSLQLLAYPPGHPVWINRYAENRNLDPALLCAVILEESRFDPQALSVAGARGLMQIMPATGKDIAKSLKVIPFGADRLYDPELNIRFGSWYLAKLLEDFGGKTYLAVAAYNAGPRAVRNWLARFPGLSEDEFVERIPYLETRNYVVRVLTSRQVYNLLYRRETANNPDDLVKSRCTNDFVKSSRCQARD